MEELELLAPIRRVLKAAKLHVDLPERAWHKKSAPFNKLIKAGNAPDLLSSNLFGSANARFERVAAASR